MTESDAYLHKFEGWVGGSIQKTTEGDSHQSLYTVAILVDGFYANVVLLACLEPKVLQPPCVGNGEEGEEVASEAEEGVERVEDHGYE